MQPIPQLTKSMVIYITRKMFELISDALWNSHNFRLVLASSNFVKI